MDNQKPEFSVPTKVETPQQEVSAVDINRLVMAEISNMTILALERAVNGDFKGAVEAVEKNHNDKVNQVFDDTDLDNDAVFEQITDLEARKARSVEQILTFGGLASDQVIERGGTTTKQDSIEAGNTQEDIFEIPGLEIEPTELSLADLMKINAEHGDELEPEEIDYALRPMASDADTAKPIRIKPVSFGGFEEVVETGEIIELDKASKDIDHQAYDKAFNDIVESLQKEPDLKSSQAEYLPDQTDALPSKRDGLAYEALETDPIAYEITAINKPNTPNGDSLDNAVERMSEKTIERKVSTSTNDAKEALVIVEAIADCKKILSNADIVVDRAEVVKKKLERILKENNSDLSYTDDFAKEVLKKFFDAMENNNDDIDEIEGTHYDVMDGLVDLIVDIDIQLKKDDRSWKVVRDIVETILVSEITSSDKNKNTKTSATVFTPTISREVISLEDEIDAITPIKQKAEDIISTLESNETIKGDQIDIKSVEKIAKNEKLDIASTATDLQKEKLISLATNANKMKLSDAVAILIFSKNKESANLTKTQKLKVVKIVEEEVGQFHELKQLLDSDDASSYQPQDDSNGDDSADDNTTADDSQFALAA